MEDHTPRIYKSILYPTDFSKVSERSLVHAMRLVLSSKGKICVLHSDKSGCYSKLSDFPHVRDLLIGWGTLPPHPTPKDIANLQIDFRELRISEENPLDAILMWTKTHETDLIILTTHCRKWIYRLIEPSIAETSLRRTGKPTLFFPENARDFVSPTTGHVNLQRILVPIAQMPPPGLTIDAVTTLIETLHCDQVSIRLLFVGDYKNKPKVKRVMRKNWQWEEFVVEGNVVDRILEQATNWKAHLIAMTTQGHDSFFDSLMGSTMERVLHHAKCPVLGVPFMKH